MGTETSSTTSSAEANGLSWMDDRLYGISYKPHELSRYGERVHFHLRWMPIPDEDEPEGAHTTHFRLLVLEIVTNIPAESDDPQRGQMLELLKIGWEIALESSRPLALAELPDPPGHLRRALTLCADLVNELARRAGYEAPLGPDVIDSLIEAGDQAQTLDPGS